MKKSISVFTLAMINVAAICSMKNWPLTAEYGFASVFYYLLAVVFFFLPASLVSAELATGWPERGGVFIWVKEALGPKMGFLAVWLQWIENVVWYPTVLTFIAGTVAYAINPELANNQIYTFCMVFATFWSATLANVFGMKTSGMISTIGVLLGTIFPGIVIMVLALIWSLGDNPSNLVMSWDSFLPNLKSIDNMTFLVGVLLGLAGMEMSATHAREVENPQKNYPRAIFLSAILIVALSVLGSLAISVVLSPGQITLHAGGIESISLFLKAYGLSWLVPVFAFLITIGAMGQITTWTAGPSKGLLAAAQAGDFPPVLHKVNKHGMPINMLIFQGLIVSFISLIFLYMPSVSSSFWMLLTLASQLYLAMYFLMFLSAIILRYRHPNVTRAYRIPGGNWGIWLISLLGLTGCSFSFVLGFFPPSQIDTGTVLFYELFLLLGIVIGCALPYIILLFKKPSWEEI